MIVPAADGGLYSPADADPEVVNFRYVIVDPNSEQGDGQGTIYDPFEVTMNWACSDDSVAIAQGDETGTQAYVIDLDEAVAHTQTIPGSVTHQYAGTECGLEAEHFYFDDSTSSWEPLAGSTYDGDPFASLDTTTGDIVLATIDQAGHNLAPKTTMQVRVVYTATGAKDTVADRTVQEEFDVIFRVNLCKNNVITLGTPIADSEYYLGQTDETGIAAEYQIDYSTDVATDDCPIDAVLYIEDSSTGDWVEYDPSGPLSATGEYHSLVDGFKA